MSVKQGLCRALQRGQASPRSSYRSLSPSSSQWLTPTRNLSTASFSSGSLKNIPVCPSSCFNLVQPSSESSLNSSGSGDSATRRDKLPQQDQRRRHDTNTAALERLLGDFIDSPAWKRLLFALAIAARLDTVFLKVLDLFDEYVSRLPSIIESLGFTHTHHMGGNARSPKQQEKRKNHLLTSFSSKEVLRTASEDSISQELLSPAKVKATETIQDDTDEWGHFAYYEEEASLNDHFTFQPLCGQGIDQSPLSPLQETDEEKYYEESLLG